MGSRKKVATPAQVVVDELVAPPVVDSPPAPAIALHYTGGPIYGDAPARDLSAADLAYIHRVGALRASGGDPVEPATEADIAALADRLERTGSFARNDPSITGPAAPVTPAEEN